MTDTMLQADAGVTERARRLHDDSLVIDSLGPAGPFLFTEAQEEAMIGAVAAGATIGTLMDVAKGVAEDPSIFDPAYIPPGYWEAWRESGVDVSSTTVGGFGARAWSYEAAVQELAARRANLAGPEVVLDSATIDRVHAEGKRGLILNFQNTDHLDGDLNNLDLFFNLGIRVIQLTYNSRNLVGDGCTERTQAGLSHFGVSLVQRMNELGILVDVSHCGRGTTLDAIELSEKPVAITHSFAEAVHSHPRGKSDDEIRAICEGGGYFGVLVLPFFISSEPSPGLDVWLRHFEHVLDLAGPEHVGIGTDAAGRMPKAMVELANKAWGPGGEFGMRDGAVDLGRHTQGFETWHEGWPRLTETLVAAGYRDDEIRGFLGGNFYRVFKTAVG